MLISKAYSPPSSTDVKEWVELYLYSPNTPSWRDTQFKKKHRDNFTFPLCVMVGLCGSILFWTEIQNGSRYYVSDLMCCMQEMNNGHGVSVRPYGSLNRFLTLFVLRMRHLAYTYCSLCLPLFSVEQVSWKKRVNLHLSQKLKLLVGLFSND
jgi:hypothetical protein